MPRCEKSAYSTGGLLRINPHNIAGAILHGTLSISLIVTPHSVLLTSVLAILTLTIHAHGRANIATPKCRKRPR